MWEFSNGKLKRIIARCCFEMLNNQIVLEEDLDMKWLLQNEFDTI